MDPTTEYFKDYMIITPINIDIPIPMIIIMINIYILDPIMNPIIIDIFLYKIISINKI